MAGLRRGVIEVEHPGQIADAARDLSGAPDSLTPYVRGANYIGDDGEPLVSIPDPGPQPTDYDVEPLNSPRNASQMLLRDMGGRAPGQNVPPVAPVVAHPAVPDGVAESVGNIVHLDDGFAHLDGQLIPLSEIDLARIGGIVMSALQRKMREDYARLKSAHTMQPSSRKRKAVPAKRRARKTVPPPSEAAA